MKVRKGDTVKVMIGKDAGRQGRVVKVLPEEDRVVIEGMNVYKKHVRGDGRNRQSAIIEISKPVHVSNVMVICGSCGKASRIRFSVDGGRKTRMCVKCGGRLDRVSVAKEASATKGAAKPASAKKKKSETKTGKASGSVEEQTAKTPSKVKPSAGKAKSKKTTK
ncbi:MAG: 50S ribosomal protein L24 [Candidatus Dojkabacteria bacterium]|nr:50S ribosomal protein L24 [Candidatus Dojkabacteria bacterium]